MSVISEVHDDMMNRAREQRLEIYNLKAEISQLKVSVNYAASWLVQNIHGMNITEFEEQILKYGRQQVFLLHPTEDTPH